MLKPYVSQLQKEDKSLDIEEFGVNFGGWNWDFSGANPKQTQFSLLAHTIANEDFSRECRKALGHKLV